MQAFEDLPDPRRQTGRFQYRLEELLLTALCAVAAGAEDWVDVMEWGNFKLQWLRRFLPFEQGIASHDTFSRVFAMLDAARFEACFRRWMGGLCPSLAQEHIAIDGKTLRGTATQDGQVHLVSAWHCGAGVTLGQVKTQAKSNEITAIPELLQGLELRGATVTMDAVRAGRFGPRSEGDAQPSWRYYISSHVLDAQQFNATIRAHWAIENGCHWVMDVNYREDECLIRRNHGPQNMATLRRLAQNQIKLDASKGSQRVKRKRMGWSDDYLQELFGLVPPPQTAAPDYPD